MLVFFAIQQLHGLSALGSIASWQSIAQIIGFFTAIGWSSLILVRVSKAQTKKETVEEFNRLILMATLTLFALTICTIITGIIIKKTNDSVQISYWLAAWTAYQTSRHYFIAIRDYRSALYLDTIIIGSSAIVAFLAPTSEVSMYLAAVMLASGIVAFLLIQKGSNASPPKISYEIKGLEFGLVNFLSGAISLGLIPLATYLESEEFAGTISLFLAISGAALLIPRAISISQLPKISRTIDTPEELRITTEKIRRQITLSNIATSLLCLASAAVIISQIPESLPTTQVAITLTLITIQNSISIQTILDSSILTAKEKSKTLIKINIFSFLFFATSSLAISTSSIGRGFTYIAAIIILVNLYRFSASKTCTKKYITPQI